MSGIGPLRVKCCETVTSGEKSGTKNVTVLDGINKHVCIYLSTYLSIYWSIYLSIYLSLYIYIYIYTYIYLLGETIFSPKFSKWGGGVGVRKKWLGGLKEFLPCWIFARGLAMFLVKKRLSKIKYGFEFSISNVDLGLF